MTSDLSWPELCRTMLENHGILPHQVVEMPVVQLMALAPPQPMTREEALAIHRQRQARKSKDKAPKGQQP